VPVTMQQVINQLDREEPNYEQAALLGADAIPHLVTLIRGPNVNLAAKAASLAGIMNAAESADALQVAAMHPQAVVRVAAAAAAKNLSNLPMHLALSFLNDSDPGVRKWTLETVRARQLAGLKSKVEEMVRNDPDLGLRDRARTVVDVLP
jgi:hypothetical protein